MENAPFGVNPAENAILEKVCKSVPFFAGNAGKRGSEEVIRGRSGAGLGGEGGCLRKVLYVNSLIGKIVPRGKKDNENSRRLSSAGYS
jgi:hypothetical protein